VEPETDGTGTYLIDSQRKLMYLIQEWDTSLYPANFELTKDLDFEDCEVNGSIADDGTPSRELSGTFDGGGFTIRNLQLNNSRGLFGFVDGDIENVNFDGQVDGTGKSGVGGLVGTLRAGGSITNSSSAGSVTSNGSSVGGLVGNLDPDGGKATIFNSFSSASISTTNNNVGGLIGDITAGSHEVKYSYATGSVSGFSNVGGFIGLLSELDASITDSYSTGLVTGSLTSGGFVGGSGGGSVTNSFWDTDTSGLTTSGGGKGTGKSTAEMQDITTFTTANWNISSGYDAGSTWGICSAVNSGYPFLTAFYSSDPCSSGGGGGEGSTGTGPPAEFEFTFWLPDGSECTAISPVTVVDGTDYTLPGVDADCRTMPGATVGGWTIPVAPGVTGAGSKFLPFNPAHVVEVSGSQQFTVVPFEPAIELVFDSNVGAGAVCSPNDVEHTDADQRLRYVWAPRESVSLARVPAQAACSPEGYTLAQWNTAPDGSGTAFAPGAGIPEMWGTASGNTYLLYAIWHR